MTFNPGDTSVAMLLLETVERRDKVIEELQDLLNKAHEEIDRLKQIEFWYNRMRDL